ncbi:hypothetical protein Tco_1394457 [Tanacetum coccineum]
MSPCIPGTSLLHAEGALHGVQFHVDLTKPPQNSTIYDGYQANTSRLSFSKRISCSRLLKENMVLMVTICSRFGTSYYRSYSHWVGNFTIACTVDETTLRSCIPVRPKMMLYEDDAQTTVNFIMMLRVRPPPPNFTSNSIFPIGISCSPEKPTSSVWVGDILVQYRGKGDGNIHPVFGSVEPRLMLVDSSSFTYHVNHLRPIIATSRLPSPVISPLPHCNVPSHRGIHNTGLDFLFSEELPLEGKEEVVGSDGDQHEAASSVRISHGDYDTDVYRWRREYLMVKVGLRGSGRGHGRDHGSSLTNSILSTFTSKEASTCKLQTHRGTAKMERTFEEKVGLRGEGWWPSRKRLVAFAKKAGGLREEGMGLHEEGQRLRGEGQRLHGEGQGLLRTQQRLQTKVASRHKGCMLLRRLQQRLLAAVKAATKVPGCCEGCHIGYRLLQRLPHRLQAATKASITVAGFYEGCHKGCRLLQRLNDAVKATTELIGSCEGCHIGYNTAKKASTSAAMNATTKLVAFAEAGIYVVGCCEDYNEACSFCYCEGCNVAKKAAPLLRRSSLTNSILSLFTSREALTYKLQTHRGTAKMERTFEEKVGLRGEGWWPSRRRLVAFPEKAWGFAEKAKGFADKARGFAEKTRGFAEKAKGFLEKARGFFELNGGRRRRLHHLGEYVITLYKNGKLRTIVTVTLVGGVEGTSSLPFWSSSPTLFFSLSGLAGSLKDSRMGRTEAKGDSLCFWTRALSEDIWLRI